MGHPVVLLLLQLLLLLVLLLLLLLLFINYIISSVTSTSTSYSTTNTNTSTTSPTNITTSPTIFASYHTFSPTTSNTTYLATPPTWPPPLLLLPGQLCAVHGLPHDCHYYVEQQPGLPQPGQADLLLPPLLPSLAPAPVQVTRLDSSFSRWGLIPCPSLPSEDSLSAQETILPAFLLYCLWQVQPTKQTTRVAANVAIRLQMQSFHKRQGSSSGVYIIL